MLKHSGYNFQQNGSFESQSKFCGSPVHLARIKPEEPGWIVSCPRSSRLLRSRIPIASVPCSAIGTNHLYSEAVRLGEIPVEERMRHIQQAPAASDSDRQGRGAQDPPALVVFSGGTAFNSVAGKLKHITTRVAHVLPVSDDGGSTAEIVRLLGGPAVGDIRSRCIRLADSSDEEARAVKALLAHRLSSHDPSSARDEWDRILSGQHQLWGGVSEPYKQVIRALLQHFERRRKKSKKKSGKQKHKAPSEPEFNFQNGSIGNFFFAGSRIVFGSLEAAVFQFSRVARIPEGSLVLPAIRTEERIMLGAELANGVILKGQNEISHPSAPDSRVVDKMGHTQAPLPSPIQRIFYLTHGGRHHEREVLPRANPRAVHEVEKADAIIFGMGSLFTSICPIVCLDGMGEAIAARNVPKMLLLNGSQDRETSSPDTHHGPMKASDMVLAVSDACNRRLSRRGQCLSHPPSAFVTTLLVPRDGQIEVDNEALEALGVHDVMEVESSRNPEGQVIYHPHSLVAGIRQVLSTRAGMESPPVLEPN